MALEDTEVMLTLVIYFRGQKNIGFADDDP